MMPQFDTNVYTFEAHLGNIGNIYSLCRAYVPNK